MKHTAYILLLAALCAAHPVCRAQTTDSVKTLAALTRCWRAISHEYSNIYGLEEEDIKRYSKQKMCFTRDSIVMLTGSLYSPRYSIRKVDAEDYSKTNFDCDKHRLGILKDSVVEITINSATRPNAKGVVHQMTDVIIWDDVCLYVVVDGVIFKMLDTEVKAEGRSSN